eukprot:359635_1
MSHKKISHTHRNNEFIWKIEGNLFKLFTNAKNEQKFTSKEFTICGATWTINCYPNGYETDDNGYCSLFLHCCSLPIYSSSIEVNYHISFVEIAEIKHLAKSFSENISWGYSQAFKHTILKQLKPKKK